MVSLAAQHHNQNLNMIWSVLTTFFRIYNSNAKGSSLQQHDPLSAKCAVCLSSLEGTLSTRVLPCLHEFHRVCINRWLAVPRVKTCPICRFLVNEKDSVVDDGHEQALARQESFTEEMVIWFSSFHVAGF